MGKTFSPGPWICPADSLIRGNTHTTGTITNLAYPYSYSMNYALSAEVASNPTSNLSLYCNGRSAKMAAIRHSFTTVMMAEESEATIDDGSFITCVVTNAAAPWTFSVGGTSTSPNDLNYLSVRHDGQRRTPDNVLGPTDQEGIPDSGCRGNVVFCDGHADFVTRQYAQSATLKHWDWTN